MLMSFKKDYILNKKKLWNENHSKKKGFFTKNYQKIISHYYSHIIPQGSSILEIGCGDGTLLNSLNPIKGVGIDFSSVAIDIASKNKKDDNINLILIDDFVDFINDKKIIFDYIILSDLINDIYDIDELLKYVRKHCNSETRVVFNYFSNVWKAPRDMMEKLTLCNKLNNQNWIDPNDLKNILHIQGFEVVSNKSEIFIPLNNPISNFFNKYLAKIWPFKFLNLTNFLVARKLSSQKNDKSVSIVIPCRNEQGHIKNLINQIPKIGTETEVIFIEGGSKDKTYDEIESLLNTRSDITMKLIKQKGSGKGDAVRSGFDICSNEIFMILDSDISVLPQDLIKFYNAIILEKGEFINGVRLVYPMEDRAMRFLNLLGNKFFAYAFSWVLNQNIKDTLCGTKVLTKVNYEKIKRNRKYFGDFDPFGDFDLIFGAAKQNLKVLDLPVRYFAREYGETNISRWSHGLLLLRMLYLASKKIKFI
tara:strand:- start:333 stop:1763 length:1431 start_codon:yes stop_codon:yes gene_type:complete